ncbi:hypothetical protein Ade02nite_19550 [Paractinoplanes deccanensis]|uniref:Uncharacterized protein n=2 Tax=Paractinoplanes deccanensis TaxID=113561 RepID=A0ABQ3XZY8_9ACTN|nr:hypothetical protein Ade02nite_19550 [Actinoplanes deccanensis]
MGQRPWHLWTLAWYVVTVHAEVMNADEREVAPDEPNTVPPFREAQVPLTDAERFQENVKAFQRQGDLELRQLSKKEESGGKEEVKYRNLYNDLEAERERRQRSQDAPEL